MGRHPGAMRIELGGHRRCPFPAWTTTRKLPPGQLRRLARTAPCPARPCGWSGWYRTGRVTRLATVRRSCRGRCPATVMVRATVLCPAGTPPRSPPGCAPAATEFSAISRMCSESSSIFPSCSGRLARCYLYRARICVHIVHDQPAVHLIVDGDDRGQAAGADAAAGIQRKLAVGCTFAAIDAQLFLEGVVDIARSLYIAGSTPGKPIPYTVPWG